MRLALALAVAATWCASAPARAQGSGGGAQLLVFPAAPGVDTAPATAAARAAGFAPIVVAAPDAGGDAALLGDAEKALAAALAAWLAQRPDDMAAALADVERALPLLARREHAASLWQYAFARGLLAQARGDGAGAAGAFALAVEIAPERRPERGTWPPAVIEAFALAAEAHARRVARPLALRITPADAAVVIDGVPVLDTGKPRLVRPGRHVVLVEAPGFASVARLVELDDAPLEFALAPLEGADPQAALAPLWRRGELRLEGATTQRLLRAWARSRGAVAVLIVAADGTAQLLGPDSVEAAGDPAAALRGVGPDGRRRDPVTASRAGGSILRSGWFWAGTGAVVVGLVVLSLALSVDDPVDRTHIGVSP